MKEVTTVILENGLEYMEIDEVVYNDSKYILLVNYKNYKDFCIRRIKVSDNQEYFVKIIDEVEYNKVLNLFVKKNKVLF